jgi:PAS domain S-box-containing protein
MPDWISRLFSTDDFMPHGHCYLWNPGLVWLHVVSDGLTAVSYTTIPFTLVYFARRRKDIPFNWMFMLFGLFIVACGATHYLEILTLWTPVYWVSGGVKAVTAAASVPTAILLVKLVPRALAIPTQSELDQARDEAAQRELENESLRQARAADAKVRGVLEAAPDAMVIVDGDGRISLVNEQVEALFGYAREELIGQPMEILVPKAHHADFFTETRPRPMSPDLDLHGRRQDGTEFPAEISLSPMQTEEGKLVIAAIRDVTERRKFEELRFRLAAIVDSSEDAIIGETLEGVITSWNRGAQRIFGHSAEEVVGKPVSVLVPPGSKDEETPLLGRVRKGERIAAFDTVRRRKDGEDIDVSVTLSPVLDTSGGIVGASRVDRDITERKRAEAALARAKDAAERANRELAAFSYSVAHDLRAPLRGMNGFAQALLDDYRDKLDAEGVDYLEEIHANARRMGAIIDALLSLARVTRGELRRERVDLSALARVVAAELSAAEPGRRVDLAIRAQLQADADPLLARTLLENLLGNAWKFTGKASAPRVELGALAGDGAATFFVRDNGAGFDMAHADKLFAPFQRLHTVGEFPGTGIGLATVQRIVRHHGGRIWAEGAVGAGATFYFTLSGGIGEGVT